MTQKTRRSQFVLTCLWTFSGLVFAGCRGTTATAPPSSAPAAIAPASSQPVKLLAPTSVAALDSAYAADPELLRRRNKDGCTVLHLAAERGDADVVRRMLELGADPNDHTPAGATALLSAGSGLVNEFNRLGAPPSGSQDTWSPAKARRRAIELRGRPDPARGPMQFEAVIGQLLAHGADVNATVKENRGSKYPGVTVLHLAAMAGDAGLIDLLLKAGADPSIRSEGSGTPLTAAAQWGNVDAIRRLLAAGVDVNSGDDQDRNLRGVRAMRHPEAFRLLLDSGMEPRPEWVRTASGRFGDPEALQELLKRGFDKTKLGESLYLAVKQHDDGDPANQRRVEETVKMLLEAGAPPDAPDGTGEALVAAVAQENHGVADLLRKGGVKVDWTRIRDKEHKPPFQGFACLMEGKPERLQALEALGMPLDLTGAALLGRDERVRELLQAHPDLTRGGFALFAAAAYGHEATCRLLLDAGADPNAKTPGWDSPDSGALPLDGAARRGHAAVVRLLLERGANPKAVDFDEAARAKLTPEVRKLLEEAAAKRS